MKEHADKVIVALFVIFVILAPAVIEEAKARARVRDLPPIHSHGRDKK